MHRVRAITFILLFGTLFALFACSNQQEKAEAKKAKVQPDKRTLSFLGGPQGGTFNFFANKISSLISNSTPWIDINPRRTDGSVANLCTLNLGEADMAVLYTGDAFLGRNRKLGCGETAMDNTRALGFLYGAPAQLIVRSDSGIETVDDLVGKKIAVGNPGSGALLSAQRFFKHLGLWDQMDRIAIGYSQAAEDFDKGLIDGFWVLVGYPNVSVVQAASNTRVRLLNLYDPALKSGFFELYPFYSRVVIPTGTYEHQEAPVVTFQDFAIWCASSRLDDDVVYASLHAIYTPKGLEAMHKSHKAAMAMSMETGIANLSIPLHPGAVRFWSNQGTTIPPILLQ